MKTIIPGIITFIVCLLVYLFASSAINIEKQRSYKLGYLDGFKVKTQIEADSLDSELKKHRANLDSLFNELKSMK